MSEIWDEKPRPLELLNPLAPWGVRKIYSADEIDVFLEKLKEKWKKLESERWEFQERNANQARMIRGLKEKAEKWDQYAIYDNDNEPEILVKDLIIAYEKLEAAKKLLFITDTEELIELIPEGGPRAAFYHFIEQLRAAVEDE